MEMRESPSDLTNLQNLLDSSIEQAGSFLRDSMELDSNSLTAKQVARRLEGLRTVSLASVTARGEPRVAPITAIFIAGHYVVPTVVDAARSRHLRRRPGVSLTEYSGNDMAITVHGQAAFVDSGHPDFPALDELYQSISRGERPSSWGGGGPLHIRVVPDVMYATATNREEYPE